MKRIATAVLAAAMFAGSAGVAAPAAAHDNRRGDWNGRDRDYDNWDDRRDERRRYREGYRDGRRHERWDNRRHNGYWHDGRWYYGPPPREWRDVRYDYRAWRRGDRLPRYYRDQYVVVDYRRHGLRAPPRGYHYVRDDRGDYLLVGIATGVILGLILAD
jgi:Ni/Co efflux regulator RcnB